MEYWDVYDAQGNPLGKQVPKNTMLPEGEYHIAVEAWILDVPAKKVLIQQRSESCELAPGKWGLTTGRIVSGENSLTGCAREVQEELGLAVEPEELQFVRRIPFGRYRMIWDVYMIEKPVDISTLSLQKDEVAQVKWVTPDEFRTMLDQKYLVWFPEVLELLAYMEQVFESRSN